MNVISASPLAAFVASPSNTPSGSGGGEPGSFDAVFAGLAESATAPEPTDTTAAEQPDLEPDPESAVPGAELPLVEQVPVEQVPADQMPVEQLASDLIVTVSGSTDAGPAPSTTAADTVTRDVAPTDEPAPTASVPEPALSDRTEAPAEAVRAYEHVDAQSAADAAADVVATDVVATDVVATDVVDAAPSDVDEVDPGGEATVGEVSTPSPAAEVVAAVIATQPVALADGPDSVVNEAPSVEPPAGETEPSVGPAPTPSPTTAAAAMPSAPSAGAGPSASAESLTTPAPGAPTADYARQLEQVRQRDVLRVGSTTRLGMSISTEELGTLRLDAVDRSGALHLTLTADDRVARATLVDRSNDLRDALSSDGISFDVGTRDDRAGHQSDSGSDSRPDRSDQGTRRVSALGATQSAPSADRRAVSVDGQLDLQL